MPSIFSRIIAREIPAYIIAEDKDFISFLDIAPLAEGHALVIPKLEIDYIFDLDDQALAGLHVFSKKVAEAIRKSVDCKRIGVAVVGLEVPHAHIHLIPIRHISDIDFSRPKLKLPGERMSEIAAVIRSNM